MTRLANIEKAGYFPLPASVTERIVSHIAAPYGGRILDPCAGAGTALVTLAGMLNLVPFCVERHEDRAHAAREAVDETLAERDGTWRDDIPRVLNDSYQNLITSRDGYNLLYLNPPTTTTTRTAGWSTSFSGAAGRGCSRVVCWSGWCLSTCSSSARRSSTYSLTSMMSASSAFRMIRTTSSARSSSSACAGARPQHQKLKLWITCGRWPREKRCWPRLPEPRDRSTRYRRC